MSVDVIVMRPSGLAVELSEWMEVVEADPDLQIRAAPYELRNPMTGEMMRMAPGEADAELRVGEGWLPCLSYRRGALMTRYIDAYDDERHPVRVKIASIARRLGAIITTDAGDDPLDW